MALFRDPKIVKTVAEILHIEQINDEACKIILSDIEQKLRLLIQVDIQNLKTPFSSKPLLKNHFKGCN